MFTFRTSITFAVMAFIVALAVLLLIAIQGPGASLGNEGSCVRLYGRDQCEGLRAPTDGDHRDSFVGACAGDQFQRSRFK